MAAMLDIFDQEKVWEMALKAERREGREEGFASGIISVCREMAHMEDQEIIRILMEKMHVSREKAAEYLAVCGEPDTQGK